MSQYQRIFLIADPEMQRTPAFERAAHLAKNTGAKLLLELFGHHAGISAAGAASTEVMEMAKTTFLQERQTWLDNEAEQLRNDGIDVEAHVTWGTPTHERIIERVLETVPDLVVKDIHVEPALKRLLYTPLDWQLARLCPAPLLLVNAHAHVVPQRVIASVDTSCTADHVKDLNETIVHAALQLSLQCDASLQLVHSFDGLTTTSMADPQGDGLLVSEAYETLRKVREERFSEFAKAHGVADDAKHFFDGTAADTIADFADTTAVDVVVVGSVYREGLERLLIGSTAERILQRVHCDVLIVKPASFRQALAKHLKLPEELLPSFDA